MAIAVVSGKKSLIIGSGSRVGQMLRAAWPENDAVFWQSRAGASPRWSLADGVQALAANMAAADVVVCLAGATPGGAAALSLNRDIAEAVVRAAARAACVRRVFLASSMAVYGAAGGVHAEADACRPANDYGRAKLDMERAAADLARRLGIAVTALRIGNVVGADALFVNLAAGRAITLDRFADGRGPRRSYVDPLRLGEVLRALAALARDGAELPGVLNLAAAPPLAMDDLLQAAGAGYATRPAPEAAIAEAAMDLTRLIGLVPAAAAPCDAGLAVAAWRSVRVAA